MKIITAKALASNCEMPDIPLPLVQPFEILAPVKSRKPPMKAIKYLDFADLILKTRCHIGAILGLLICDNLAEIYAPKITPIIIAICQM